MIKKILPVLIVAVAVFLALPKSQGFVDLPESQEIAIAAIVSAVVALVFDFAITRVPWLEYFRQYREAWSASLALLLIHGLENLLPTGSDVLSVNAVGLLIAAVLYLLGRVALARRGLLA